MSLIRDVLNELEHFKHDTKKMRTFGLVLGFILLAPIFYAYVKHKPVHYLEMKLSFSVLLLSSAFLFPRIYKYPLQAWMLIALTIGWFMSRFILILLYYVILSPMALFARAFGKKYLDMSFKDPNKRSYWFELNPSKDKEHFYKMYYQ